MSSCHSKWCSWLQALAQVSVAAVIVYAGLIVNSHMESWTHSFSQGTEDLHSIRTNMNSIAYSMESINNDMEDIKERMEVMANIGADMNHNVATIETDISILNEQINYMNYSVGGINNRFNPSGMMRGFMPF